MPPVRPLEAAALCPVCDPAQLAFETTAGLADLVEPPGQERALEALRFGTGIRHEGYNLFVMGSPEVGKRTLVRSVLDREAARQAVPSDLGYLHNFERPWRPRALRLPAGRLRGLRQDLERLVEDLKAALPASLEGEAPRARKQAIEDELKERHERAMEALREQAESRSIGVVRTPLGMAFAPLKDGEILPPEEFERLDPEARARIGREIEQLQAGLKRVLDEMHAGARAAREKLRALRDEVLHAAVDVPLRALLARWADAPEVVRHLEAVRKDVVEHAEEFFKDRGAPEGASEGPLDAPEVRLGGPFRRYLVNVLVDRSEARGAPVVYEPHATLSNLVGRTEHLAHLGALLTDFHLIKPGALHLADGGTLVLEARDVLTQPYAWESLKRALRTREARIESLGQALSLVSTVTLEPEPFPLDVKVVLLGERLLHALLDAHDPEFRTLFKVAVDVEEDVARSVEGDLLFARLVGTVARREGLLPLHRGAVARLLERSVRVAGASDRLSAHMGTLVDLVRQSDWWARQAQRPVIGAEDVDAALEAAERRHSRVRERLLEETLAGTLHVETDGARVGQVNGLAVLGLGGGVSFGRPSRITARVRLGRGEVVDIEREVELGGPLHTKGVLILSSFLGARYAPEHPLSLAASLVFEQSYGPIDGDSASSAELYALLSALADAPLAQGRAVTGSVDQHGRVQPIGGVNEKVEGFFDLCRARGLTGAQGVLVPATNVRHLALARRVREAVAADRFHVWPVATIDEGLELLTGLPSGDRGPDGRFPEGSVNRRVEERLVALARRRLELGREAAAGGGAAGGGAAP